MRDHRAGDPGSGGSSRRLASRWGSRRRIKPGMRAAPSLLPSPRRGICGLRASPGLIRQVGTCRCRSKTAKPGFQRARPAEPLKPDWDLGVIQARIIAAVGADDLEQVGVAVLRPAVHDPDRLASQARRCAMAGLTGGRGHLGVSARPRAAGMTGPAAPAGRSLAVPDSTERISELVTGPPGVFSNCRGPGQYQSPW